jgi:hypothetical protein
LKVGDRVVVPFTIACGRWRLLQAATVGRVLARHAASELPKPRPDRARQELYTAYLPRRGLFGYSHMYGALSRWVSGPNTRASPFGRVVGPLTWVPGTAVTVRTALVLFLFATLFEAHRRLAWPDRQPPEMSLTCGDTTSRCRGCRVRLRRQFLRDQNQSDVHARGARRRLIHRRPLSRKIRGLHSDTELSTVLVPSSCRARAGRPETHCTSMDGLSSRRCAKIRHRLGQWPGLAAIPAPSRPSLVSVGEHSTGRYPTAIRPGYRTAPWRQETVPLFLALQPRSRVRVHVAFPPVGDHGSMRSLACKGADTGSAKCPGVSDVRDGRVP